ncbi:MAG: hemolysin [Flavobacteriales bacterium]|nr:hemolysin [Flavobacteriales bacterium]|tara:strand:- start:43729 stop:44985 length:1257 start_codon:yes stop_codon:yes gene_type:complete
MLIAIALISLLFSAFFSGVEIAFISANKLQLELDKSKGKFSSNMIAFFCKNESDFITTMLVGNNISLVVYGIVMTQILSPSLQLFLNSYLLLLLAQTIITTLIVLVTAEFLPKAIFRIFPNQILNIFSIPIWLFFIILRPIALLMLNIANVLLKHVLKQNIAEDKQVFGKTDLDDFLSNVKSAEGVEDSRVEVEMLQNALDLSDKKIRECMIPRTEIIAFDVSSSINEIKEMFVNTKLSKLLVYKGNIDKIIGYVHSSDLFKSPKNVRSVLLPIQFVPESMKAMELLNQFIESNKGIAVVVDEFGGTSGIITIEDVTEEIVGEIVDEHDDDEVVDRKIDETTFVLFGRSYVDNINKRYNINLPESDEYETIAGLLLSYFEEIPQKDDVIKLEDYHFTITSVNKTTIQEVKLVILLDSD